tara:strand:+ start:1061 stop:1807 length:747 start_codon:yes stop_codon:yes gene_type:complete
LKAFSEIMININRQNNSPASLNTAEIRQYIQDAIGFLNNPTNPKPTKPVSYRNSDLLDAFDDSFHSKCYLTELKFVNSYIMDIEHLIPQNERPDLVYEWSNLFPAEHYTNMIKPRTTPIGGYLDACEPTDNVEEAIIYTLSPYGYDPLFEPNDINCQKTKNTCDLLDRVHNGHNATTIKATQNLRHSIHKKYIDILLKINEWRGFPDGTQEKAQTKRELKGLISRKNSFTMLMRSMPAVRQLPNDFLD